MLEQDQQPLQNRLKSTHLAAHLINTKLNLMKLQISTAKSWSRQLIHMNGRRKYRELRTSLTLRLESKCQEWRMQLKSSSQED
jgi:hypothetical protein